MILRHLLKNQLRDDAGSVFSWKLWLTFSKEPARKLMCTSCMWCARIPRTITSTQPPIFFGGGLLNSFSPTCPLYSYATTKSVVECTWCSLLAISDRCWIQPGTDGDIFDNDHAHCHFVWPEIQCGYRLHRLGIAFASKTMIGMDLKCWYILQNPEWLLSSDMPVFWYHACMHLV